MNTYIFVVISVIIQSCITEKTLFEEGTLPVELSLPKDDIKQMDEFIKIVSKFIEESRRVALYKWRKGKVLHQPDEDRKIIKLAEELAREYGSPLDETVQLMSDIIHAGRIIESVLTYDWYAKRYFENVLHPYGDIPNIHEIRASQKDMQQKIIKAFGPLSRIQKMETCAQNLALMLFKSAPRTDEVKRIALQRALGNFCKIVLSHNNQ